MPGSPDTRSRIIEAAIDVLQKETITGASIGKVIEAANIARKTFYLHFKSKDELLAAVVEHQRPYYVARFRQYADLAGNGASPRKKIKLIFQNVAEAAKNPDWKGCLYIRLATELAHYTGHPVRLMVAEANEDLANWLDEEILPGHFPEARAVSRQLALLLNGMVMTLMITRMNDVVDNTHALVDLLLPERPVAQAA